MTSTQETCRERIASASVTASIITISDGRIAAAAGCVVAAEIVVAAAPANAKISRRFTTDRLGSVVGAAMDLPCFVNFEHSVPRLRSVLPDLAQIPADRP